MKRFGWVLVSTILLSIFINACDSTNLETDGVNSTSVVQVAVGAFTPPFGSVDEYTGELEGFDIDLIEAIADKTDLAIEIIVQSEDEEFLLNDVSQCRVDVGISSIPITDNLKQRLNFSTPYFYTMQSLVVKEGNIEINGVNTLKGMLVSTLEGSPSEIELMKLAGIGVQTKTYRSFTDAFDELALGYFDAVIADTPRAERYVDIKPYNLKIAGEPFGDAVGYSIAVCKQRPELLETINEGLRIVTENGTLTRLMKKWNVNSLQ